MVIEVEKAMSTQNQDQDIDHQETLEWLEAIEGVLHSDGADRAHFLLEEMIDKLRRSGANLPHKPNTAYVNTIPTKNTYFKRQIYR